MSEQTNDQNDIAPDLTDWVNSRPYIRKLPYPVTEPPMIEQQVVVDTLDISRVFLNELDELFNYPWPDPTQGHLVLDNNPELKYNTGVYNGSKQHIQQLYVQSIEQILLAMTGDEADFALRLITLPQYEFFGNIGNFNDLEFKNAFKAIFVNFAIHLHQRIMSVMTGDILPNDFLLVTCTTQLVIFKAIWYKL